MVDCIEAETSRHAVAGIQQLSETVVKLPEHSIKEHVSVKAGMRGAPVSLAIRLPPL